MWTTNPELAKLLANPNDGYKYMQGSNKRVDWICPICGNLIKNLIINDIKSKGLFCKLCSDGISYPNKFITNMLKQLGIKHELEVRFKWSGKYIYDCFIEKYKIIIEMDGRFHYRNNPFDRKQQEEISYVDHIKDELAFSNGFKLIRIDCNYNFVMERQSYIKESIINSELPNLLGFNEYNVNWDLIDKSCQKSLVKTACDLWNSNTNTKEISRLIGVGYTTILNYLKLGTKVGWCEYNPKESVSIKIICIETNKIYNSIQEASDATNIHRNCIGNCLNGLSNTAGGFRWIYYK